MRVALLVTLLLALPARAYRPFDQTDADVAEPKHVELELGPIDYLRTRGEGSLAPSFVVNYGILDRWELVFGGLAPVALSSGGPSWQLETALLAKAILREGTLQRAAGPSVALEFGALLPALHGSDGLGASATLIASQRWPVATIHLNLETDLTRDHQLAVVVGAIAEGPSSWAVRPVAEVFVAHPGTNQPLTLSGLLGAIWRLSDAWSLDAAARLARVDGVGRLEIRAGLTVAFGI
jgi:hypothetical protein